MQVKLPIKYNNLANPNPTIRSMYLRHRKAHTRWTWFR